MALKIKVGLIGAFDMLKFKNMAKKRDKHIKSASAKPVTANYPINNMAKAIHPDFINVKVAEVIKHENCGAKTYVFEAEEGQTLPYFRAGQYISLKLQIEDSFVSRPYSLSSGPKEAKQGRYEITVKTNPGGFAADWMLEKLRKGSRVTISGPLGEFYYDRFRDCKNIIAVAGGSGITPFMSMAKAIRDGIEDFNLTILFGSRTEKSILFKEELDEICKQTNKVKVVHVLSDEDSECYGKGFITAKLIKMHAPEGEDYSLFICGPEAMYRFLKKEVAKLDIPARFVRRESLGVTKDVFSCPGYPKDAVEDTFTITVIQGPKKYWVPAKNTEPVLVALERAGIKAPSRCRSGECGWCRSRLVSGKCFVPSENEGRRWADVHGGQIHPCASFPLSDLEIEVPGEYL